MFGFVLIEGMATMTAGDPESLYWANWRPVHGRGAGRDLREARNAVEGELLVRVAPSRGGRKNISV